MARKKSTPAWAAAPRKPRSDAKLKNLPEEDQETLWTLLHPTDEDTPPYSYEALAVHVMEEHGFEPALSSISEWHCYWGQKRRMDAASARAEQAKTQWLEKFPNASPSELMKLGQFVFTSEAIERGDVKAFVALTREQSRRDSLELDRDKLELLKRKAAQSDEAKGVVGDAALTPEEKQTRLKGIFGMG